MPVYLFHLNIGDRVLLDDDGIELGNRLAARAEALRVIDDLSHHPTEHDRRCWANSFLVVADAEGPFLRLPIAPGGLAAVPRRGASTGEEFAPTGTLPAMASIKPSFRLAAAIQETMGHRETRSQLMEKQGRLRDELSRQIAVSEGICAHSAQLRARAQRVSSAFMQGEDRDTTGRREPPAHPHLVLLPGGKH